MKEEKSLLLTEIVNMTKSIIYILKITILTLLYFLDSIIILSGTDDILKVLFAIRMGISIFVFIVIQSIKLEYILHILIFIAIMSEVIYYAMSYDPETSNRLLIFNYNAHLIYFGFYFLYQVENLYNELYKIATLSGYVYEKFSLN